jgi:SHS2 domain-containing protein
MYETFAHMADMGIRGIGKSYEAAFINAAKGMFSIMADLSGFTKEFKVSIECRGFDREELLLDYLNQLIYQAAINRCIFLDFEIDKFSKNSLIAVAHGEKIKMTHKNLGQKHAFYI